DPHAVRATRSEPQAKHVGLVALEFLQSGQRDRRAPCGMVHQRALDDRGAACELQLVGRERLHLGPARAAGAHLPAVGPVEDPNRLLTVDRALESRAVGALLLEHERHPPAPAWALDAAGPGHGLDLAPGLQAAARGGIPLEYLGRREGLRRG